MALIILIINYMIAPGCYSSRSEHHCCMNLGPTGPPEDSRRFTSLSCLEPQWHALMLVELLLSFARLA